MGEWVFDLIAPDDRVRGRALARHRALVAGSLAGLHWVNRVWRQAGTFAPREAHMSAEMDQALAHHRRHSDQTIFGHLDAFLDLNPQDSAVRTVYWPFVALYLRWETRYPDEWRAKDSNLWSPWGRKEVILRRLSRDGLPDETRRDAADLIITAIQQPYRCKDWMYALLIRHVADAQFNDRVTALARTDQPLVRLRARFVLDLVDHPERTITRTTFRRWLEHHLNA